MGHDCMIEYYGVYYTMSYDKAIAWLYCRRTCNQTLSHAISIHVYTCTAILLFCAMILQAYIMLLCIRDVCSSEWFMRFCYWYSSDAYVVIAHPIHFPLLRFMHVFIRFCLCSAGSIRNRGDEGMCRTVFLSLNKFRMFCTCIYRHCDWGRVDRIPRKFVVLFRNTNSVF
jgi:hypothetical protein